MQAAVGSGLLVGKENVLNVSVAINKSLSRCLGL